MKNVLILTSAFGNGHITAARNTEQILKQQYGDQVKVEVVDIAKYYSRILNITGRSLYNTSMKLTPGLHKLFFEAFDTPQNMKAVNIVNYPLLKKSTQKLIETAKPDIIVSTFPVLDYPIRRTGKEIPFISIITDSSTIHYSWIASNADYFIVPDDISKKVLIEKKVDANKIFDIGFPVHKDFFTPLNREAVAKRYHLKPNKFTVLIIAHQRKTKRTKDIAMLLDEYGENIQTIIICGKNKMLHKALSKKKFKNDIQVLQWTDNIHEIMKYADLIVTKAGGATVQECIAAKTPIIVHDHYPGQEEGNAEYIQNKKIGIIMADSKPWKILCKILSLSHPGSREYKELKANGEKFHKKDSITKIGEFIAQLLHIKKTK